MKHSQSDIDGPIPASFGARAAAAAVRFYRRYISPLKPVATCRFIPTCSGYALEAISHHGACRGGLMSAVRLCKCGPWHPGGYDPVPK